MLTEYSENETRIYKSEALHMLGDIYKFRGDNQTALDYYKQAIREKGFVSLTDLLRHEGTHQVQILSGMTNVRSMEIDAYMTNICHPATSGTIQKVFCY
jgi:hypothetical protein